MARLIDADVMRQEWLENGENEYVYDTNDVLDSIDAQPTVNMWIPVTERMPDVNKTKSGYEETTVIVTIAGCKKSLPMTYERACVRGKTVYRWKWVWGKLYDWNEITHWMPFPEPKKEDGE